MTGTASTPAFPNAYISTDEPPRRSTGRTVMCLVTVFGVSYLGLMILALSLFWSEFSPVTLVAGDYGVGAFGPLMNFGFLAGGIGVLSLALAVLFFDRARLQKVGAGLLISAGLALALNTFYQTDIEGAVRTLHGTIHGVCGAIFFFVAPVGLLLISLGFGRKSFWGTLVSFALGAAALAGKGAFSLNAGGLAERFVILIVFSSLVLTAVRIFRES